jgi:phosphoribosylamine---glycine ligase
VAELNVLVVGSGGREHALAWALARSPQVERVFVAPGNAGTIWPGRAGRAEALSVPISAEDIEGLVAFAWQQNIRLTVVGPENPLALGIIDHFRALGLRAFGPTQAAAQLESSKTFAKDFMRSAGIPTAKYASFEVYEEARDFIEHFGKPVVVKADGLAAGKGVVVCDTVKDAEAALKRVMINREFGAAGRRAVIEERLSGPEISAMAFCDGQTVAMMPLARDHKRVFDDDRGPNTGGMGAYAPVPDVSDDLQEMIYRTILQPTVNEMAERGIPYTGILYAGLMLTADGPKVLEFNCRFGDPETEAIMPLLDSDLAEIMIACTESRLNQIEVCWYSGACATVVLASEGYPGKYPKGLPISGLEADSEQVMVFHAGTAVKDEQIVTAGGRVLSVSAYDDTLDVALLRAYEHIGKLHFDGMHYRRDIGRQSAQAGASS